MEVREGCYVGEGGREKWVRDVHAGEAGASACVG